VDQREDDHRDGQTDRQQPGDSVEDGTDHGCPTGQSDAGHNRKWGPELARAAPPPGIQNPRARGHRAFEGYVEDAQRNANRIAAKRVTPSPIRTLPSAPESHRIVLVACHVLAGCTAGRDLIVITRDLTQTPKAVLSEL
jgi:hypothetical protein